MRGDMFTVHQRASAVRLFQGPLTLGWAIVVAGACFAGCGFADPPPAGSQGGSSTSGSNAGGVTSVAGGGSGGDATVPTAGSGGDATAGQGGQGVQGGTAGAGGADALGGGGMSVAGGPPVYSAKPMSVIAYSPYRNGQEPGGAQPTQQQVREDLEMLRPLVDGVRIYGTDGANAYVPALCDELGIDLHIGAWLNGLSVDEANALALAEVVNRNHPSIKTAIVGNEVLHRSASNGVTEERLIELINITKSAITVPNVKIAAADTFPQWMMNRPNLAAAVDIVIWHTYGWWSGADIADAYALVSSRYDQMLAAYPGKPMILGETGWPSMYDRQSSDMTTTAVGSEANQARFYREALAGFRARNLPMWMFSAIDEQWKATSDEGMVGAWWGIFTTARQPKMAVLEMMTAP